MVGMKYAVLKSLGVNLTFAVIALQLCLLVSFQIHRVQTADALVCFLLFISLIIFIAWKLYKWT